MLARGKVHALAGRGGIGKTTLMLAISATISSGDCFPGCVTPTDEGSILYISGEDDAGDTLMPRFMASGGEPERIIFMKGLLSIHGQFLSIFDHHLFIEDLVNETGAVLLVLDPVTEFCGRNIDNNSPTHVRSVLGRLQQIAESTNVAIMGITHLTKHREGAQVDRVLGSGAWTHAPRIVWGVVEDDSKYLGLMKSNVSPVDQVYPYRLSPAVAERVEVHHATIGKRIPGAQLSDYLDIAESERGRKIVNACDYIHEKLSEGPALKQDVVRKLIDSGMSKSTIKRAAREVGVKSERENKTHGSAVWSLK